MTEPVLRIVGVGGAGCRIVDRLFDTVVHPSALVAIDSDARTLDECRAAAKIQIGESAGCGMGTGGDPEAARLAALEEKEMLRALFADVGMVVVIAGLGGGAGAGAAPVVMETAREEGALALAMATLPFFFEGAARNRAARAAMKDWARHADSLLLAPNDRLAEFADDPALAGAFRKVNGILAAGIGGIEKLIVEPGLINLDFADIRSLLNRHGGIGVFAYGEGQGADKAAQALRALTGNPLLENGRALARAKAVMLGIVGGEDMTLKEVGFLAQAVSESVGPDGKMLVGTAVSSDHEGRIALTAIVPDPAASESERVAAVPPDPEPAEGEPETNAPEEGARLPRARQTRLKLEMPGKGRFKDVEPTIQNGQDLDIPTYIRRGIVIGKG